MGHNLITTVYAVIACIMLRNKKEKEKDKETSDKLEQMSYLLVLIAGLCATSHIYKHKKWLDIFIILTLIISGIHLCSLTGVEHIGYLNFAFAFYYMYHYQKHKQKY